jgi:hypothetical protein
MNDKPKTASQIIQQMKACLSEKQFIVCYRAYIQHLKFVKKKYGKQWYMDISL